MLTYKATLAAIWNDVKLVYKNFWHWNLSKVVLTTYATLASFIVSIPFLVGIFWGLYQVMPYFNALKVNDIDGGLKIILSQLPYILLILFFGLIVLSVVIFFFSYLYYLLTHVYKSYLDGEKLAIGKNHYFSWTHMWKFMGVFSWLSLYFLVPIVIGVVVFFGIGLASIALGASTSGKIILGIIGLFGFGGAAFLFVYFGIRLSFGLSALVETTDIQKAAKDYIDESFVLTKNKFWKILAIILPCILTIFLILQIFYTIKENTSGFVNFLIGVISFMTIEGLMYMTYLSLYRLLRKNGNN